ncbi:hypothetical protein CSKR_105529 [Clonorchis sinensis]|uniref:Uncharacterized protein n=1 Tax=Clonorchis sinensis TaxID=79923 RepID=A0A3R7CRI0_CLOSI|nr:hypothetical protein CSKR_105529 [Clonorchis sinensis]
MVAWHPSISVGNLCYAVDDDGDESREQVYSYAVQPRWLEMTQWLERKSINLKVHGSNPTSASRLLLSRFGQPGHISALLLPSAEARHRKDVTNERLYCPETQNVQNVYEGSSAKLLYSE